MSNASKAAQAASGGWKKNPQIYQSVYQSAWKKTLKGKAARIAYRKGSSGKAEQARYVAKVRLIVIKGNYIVNFRKGTKEITCITETDVKQRTEIK